MYKLKNELKVNRNDTKSLKILLTYYKFSSITYEILLLTAYS